MQTETELIQALRESGCGDMEIHTIISCYRSGDLERMDKQIYSCRKRQLQALHDAQACIKRLDYLSYQLSRQ